METHTHQKCCSSDCCPSHGHEWARVDVKNFDEIKSVERSAGDSAERGCSCCGEVAGESEEVFWLNVAMLAVGALMLAVGLMGEKYISETQRWLLYGAPWLLCGWPVLKGAWQSVRRGRFFDEFTLMGGAAIAAICLGELAEALGVMIFYQIGEMFQEQAAGRSRSSIRALLATKPSVARVVRGGEFVTMVPEDVEKGMRVLVKPGEKIPVDGLVVAGESRVDTSPITGEPVPVRVASGASVFGGTVSLDGTLTVEASGAFEDSGMARIMNMVENAVARKSPVERFITKFAAVYTPVMFGVALLTALVPPLIGLGMWRDWIYRALVVLMISCPCALVISIPLGYFGGIGAASRRGILVKGGNVLDAVNEVSVVAFDKTGTLTRGVFEVANVSPADGVTEDELKRAALITESLSNHPVARSMQKAFGGTPGAVPAGADITSREVAGKGVIAVYDGEQYAAGSMNLMKDL
ncbi:MAG: HAD-IC family P-type ATPase, partial [Synergistaceae bacterium]|nr:HAD-IC family P-type ATPase [Synergistaceae bacterium]